MAFSFSGCAMTVPTLESAEPITTVALVDETERGPALPAPRQPHGWAIKTIALIAITAVLYIGKPVFLPIVTALILSFLLRPPVRLLKQWHIPKALGALLVLGVIAAVLSFGIMQLATPASAWMERLPRSMQDVKSKLAGLRSPVEKVSEVAKQVDDMTAMAAGGGKFQVEVKSSSLSDALVTGAQEFIAVATITVILLFFLLASGDSVMTRITRSFPRSRSGFNDAMLGSGGTEGDSQRFLHDTERQIAAYMWTITLINAGLGLAIGLALAALGMPNPVLWGALSFVLNYVPYLGNMIGISLVALAALISFDSLPEALAPPIAFAALVAIEANFVTPYVLGRRFAMSPIIIFVWTVFWAWLWGFSGAFIAVPMLAFLKALCDRVESLSPVARALEP
jgi:predicted PurR-regulated permease PerM